MPNLRRAILVVLAALVLSACGGGAAPSGGSAGSSAAPAASANAAPTTAPDPAAVASALPSDAADLMATGMALANNPTAVAELQATILAQKPTTDGCDPSMTDINADSSSLTATWTADARIALKGTLDAPADTDFLVFVYNNGAPIYWALFNEIDPSNTEWDYVSTTPPADDPIMGDLARQNPYTPDSKICVGVTGIKGDADLSDLTDPAKAREALVVQLRLPVGGDAPAQVALPTANPAGGAGICNDQGELPLANFGQIAPLVAGAYADAQAGAQTWQSDARLYQMEVGCDLFGGLRWDFSWVSDSAGQAVTNTPKEPTPDPENSLAPSYDSVKDRETIDPTAVATTIEELGAALVDAGYAPTTVIGVLGRITLGQATEGDFTFQPPEGGPEGVYYRVSLQLNPEELGTSVLVDAASGQVYKP